MKPAEAVSKFRDYMRLKHMALSTEQSYCAWLTRFMRFLATHQSLETTMGYLHAEALSVPRPLEVLGESVGQRVEECGGFIAFDWPRKRKVVGGGA